MLSILKIAIRFINYREVIRFFVSYLEGLAAKSTNIFDDEALKIIKQILIDKGLY